MYILDYYCYLLDLIRKPCYNIIIWNLDLCQNIISCYNIGDLIIIQ